VSAEHKLQVFGNKVPRKIFGPKKDEIRKKFKVLHNQELREHTDNLVLSG
jgi:hypothetical protein